MIASARAIIGHAARRDRVLPGTRPSEAVLVCRSDNGVKPRGDGRGLGRAARAPWPRRRDGLLGLAAHGLPRARGVGIERLIRRSAQ